MQFEESLPDLEPREAYCGGAHGKEELHNLLDTYVEQVINGRDKVLFIEAIQAAKASALRAAYITLWLCCVESLKRKLQELAIRDFGAAKVISEVEELEAAKRPVDDYLLEQSKKHGLVLANDFAKLEQLSVLQRVYSRPHEKQPKLRAFVDDAAMVVESVLGQSAKVQTGRLMEQIHLLAKEVETLNATLRQPKPTQQKSTQAT